MPPPISSKACRKKKTKRENPRKKARKLALKSVEDFRLRLESAALFFFGESLAFGGKSCMMEEPREVRACERKAGFGGSQEYYDTLFQRVKEAVDPSNQLLGAFYCQGKMPQAVRQRYENLLKERPGDTQLQASLENFDRALRHPDGEDLRKAGEWAKRMVSLAQ